MKLRNLALSLSFLPCTLLFAGITLPKVLSSHMVVQRDRPVHIWGIALPNEPVAVSFRGESRSTKATNLGRWSVFLPPGSAGGPFQMTIQVGRPSGVAPITLDDVMVGDVWLAAGQSNMEFEMRRASTAAEDLPNAGNAMIRLLIVQHKAAESAQDDIDSTGWAASTPESAKDFSAVAWYFAHEISEHENVPIGVIDSTWGGTLVENWTRLAALGEDASLMPLFLSRGKLTDAEADSQLDLKLQEKAQAEATAADKPAPPVSWHVQLPAWAPSLLWNGMIAPLTSFPIRGVIWYQGESNTSIERAPLYHRIFRTLIEDWRHEWAEGDFPFLFVQIANFKAGSGANWPVMREQQLKTLDLRSTAMTVTIDIGNPNDIHPTNKRDVGLRLARAARAISYGEEIEPNGPLFRQATPENKSIRVWFDASKGLTAKGGDLTGFKSLGEMALSFQRRLESTARQFSPQAHPFPSLSSFAMVGPTAHNAICTTAMAFLHPHSLRFHKTFVTLPISVGCKTVAKED